jgi:hypothetical protein
MASPGNYSSPAEARARRRGGRGFYADRDRPYHDKPKRLYRDRQRQPEAREAAELGRHLADLADTYPRYRGALNRTRNHVLVQARSEQWKRQVTLRSLSVEPTALEEIIEDTSLDRRSIEQALSALETKGEVARCNRQGGPVVIRRDNKPAEKVYWRKRQG